jgi:putative ABC transport system permease protein
MSGLLTDVRFGLRALRTNPTYVVLAVLCLGIGIGATTMTFTVVNNALLKPLGSIDPEGLVAIGEVRQTAPDEWWPASSANFRDWESAVAESAQISAYRGYGFDIGGGFDTRVEGAYVTDNHFAVLGVAPILGRGFQPGDDAEGADPVVLLSETFWRQRFASDRTIVGRTLRIDGTPHTVVGVVPALLDVGMPGAIRAARVWAPFRADAQRLSRDDRSWSVIARLDAGISVERFFAQLETTAAQLAAIHPEDAGWSVRVEPLAVGPLGRARSAVLLSMGAALLLLLIACANVANLTLANAMRRRHEFGIRAAIGASPWRIARQLLSESLVVATLGAVFGLIIARVGLDVLVRFYVADSLAPAELPLDMSSLAFTIGLTLLTTALFGLFPAREAARGTTRAQVAESGFGTTMARAQNRLRRGLVVGQVAASLVLMIGAALLARSFMNMLAVDGGVETEGVTSIRVELAEEPSAPDDVARFVERMLGTLSAMPGVVQSASGNVVLPLRGAGYRSRVGTPGTLPDSGPVIAYAGVTPEFFDTLQIPLLRGRTFAENEQRGRVAVVNESLAKLLWPNQDPVGRQFQLDADPERGWITVVGVSGDFVTWDSNGDRPLPAAYIDAASFDTFPLFFFIRNRNADQVITSESISRSISSLNFPFKRIVVTPMGKVARDPLWRQQMFSLWFTIFGIAAMVLTAVGIYGVLTNLVWQRGQEIGIRMALGADRQKVLLMVLRHGATFVGAGIVIGLTGASVLALAMRGLLFGIEPLDPTLFVAVTAFLALVAMSASIVPAYRAARIDPNVLLRS